MAIRTSRTQWHGGWWSKPVCELLMKYGFHWADAEWRYDPMLDEGESWLFWARDYQAAEQRRTYSCKLPDITDPDILRDFMRELEVRLKVYAGTSPNP